LNISQISRPRRVCGRILEKYGAYIGCAVES
jgi:hypothetical protein